MDYTKEPMLEYNPAENRWVLQKDYTDETTGIFVPSGYKTDLASVPRIFWFFIAPYELGEAAPLVHDWLYQHAGIEQTDKKDADKMLLKISAHDKAVTWKRYAAYYAVKFFAGSVWDKYERANENKK